MSGGPAITMRAGWWASFLAFALLGVVWALSVPPLSGPDEMAHVVKASAVARGDLGTDVRWERDEFWGFELPRTDVKGTQGYDNQTLTSRALCWNTLSDEVEPMCLRDLPSKSGETVQTSTYVGTYQPSYYAVVGWPTRLLAPDHGVLAARIVSAVLVAALVASSLTTAAAFGGAASVTATLLVITPAFVYLAGVVNPSSLEIAASLLLWCTLLALFTNPRAPRRVVIRAAVAAVCLVAVRPLSPAIAVAIFASVVVLWADRDVLERLWARRSVRMALLGVGAVLVASTAHVLATDAFNSIIVDASPEQRSALTLATEALGGTWDLAQEQVGLLGPLGVFSQRTASTSVQAWLVTVVALVLVALVVGTNRRRAGLMLVLVGSLSAPVVAAVANPDAIWLGRYSFPLAMGIPVVAGWIVDREGRIPVRVGSGFLAVVGTLVAVVYLLDYRGLFRRNLFEYPAPIAARLSSQLWDGPLTAEGMRIIAVIASAAVAGVSIFWAALLVRDRGRDGTGEDGRQTEATTVPTGAAPAE